MFGALTKRQQVVAVAFCPRIARKTCESSPASTWRASLWADVSFRSRFGTSSTDSSERIEAKHDEKANKNVLRMSRRSTDCFRGKQGSQKICFSCVSMWLICPPRSRFIPAFEFEQNFSPVLYFSKNPTRQECGEHDDELKRCDLRQSRNNICECSIHHCWT